MNRSSFSKSRLRYSNRSMALYLLALNILVFAFVYIFPRLFSLLTLNATFFTSMRYWQLLSYTFIHPGLDSLILNMLAILFFATQVESRLGSAEFLIFYLGAGLVGALLSIGIALLSGSGGFFLSGSSGCVLALLFAFALFFPDEEILFLGFFPIKAPYLVALFVLLELASLFLSRGSSLDNIAHLVGLAFAWLYLRIRFGLRPLRLFFPRRGR